MGLVSKKAVETVCSVSDDEFKAYVGEKAYKYMPTRAKIKNGKWISFSLAVLLFGPLWAAYRKMWWAVALYIGAYLFFFSTGNGLFYWLFCVMAAIGFPARYVEHACKKIQKLKGQESDPVRLREILTREGGTSKTAVVVLLLVLLMAAVVAIANDEGTGDLFASTSVVVPTCDSRSGISTARQAFEGSPISKVVAIKLFDIEEIKEVSFDEEKNIRICNGTAMTNAGRVRVKYTFSGRENGEYWVEIKELFR